MMITRVFLMLFVLTMPAAQALESAWVDKDAARWRLIFAEIDKQAYAALQVELKPGWHTYWKFPGASGIAPEFMLETTQSLEAGAPIFAAPYFFDDGVGGYFGYDVQAGFVFPLRFNRNKAGLDFSGLIGVCREICIPMEMSTGLLLDTKRLRASPHGPIIAAMLAQKPTEPSAQLGIGGISFDGVSLQIVVTGKDLRDPQVMIVPGPHDIIGPPRIAASHPASFLVEVPAWSKLDHPLIGRKLNLIIRDGMRAIEADIEVTDHRLLPRDMPN